MKIADQNGSPTERKVIEALEKAKKQGLTVKAMKFKKISEFKEFLNWPYIIDREFGAVYYRTSTSGIIIAIPEGKHVRLLYI